MDAYLDQNQWIYLARDYWGKPHKASHRGIAQRILARIMSGKLRLPLSTIHFIEHLRAEDPSRRRRLAEVFDLFSQGWYMASWASVLPEEIRAAVRRVFLDSQCTSPPQVFGRGFLVGLGPTERALLSEGRTKAELALSEKIAALPGATFDLLTFPNEFGRTKQNEMIAQRGIENARAAEESRRLRRHDPVDLHRRVKYAEYILNHQEVLVEALAACGRPWDDFLALGCEAVMDFWSEIPSLDVECELSVYRDRQWTRAIPPNDVRDIGHLALAIPYCDIVVTERFWSEGARSTGLAAKYQTAVCSDLETLLN